MTGSLCRHITGALLILCSMPVIAVEMEITAEFSPSLQTPDNNVFTNTTQQSGFCATWEYICKNLGKDIKSLATGIVLTPVRGLSPTDNPRDSLFFKWPSTFRDVPVRNNITGTTSTVKFRVSTFSGRYYAKNKSDTYNWGGRSDVAFSVYPDGGCKSLHNGWMAGANQLAWLWSTPAGNTGCYKITSVDRPEGADNYIYKVDELSFGYTLITDSPLKMESGVYTGTLDLSVGSGGDIDFGDNFKTSDSSLRIHFTLTVNHELKLTPVDNNVSLQPCGTERVCTEDQGQANWERWMITNVTPSLTGRSRFNLSSSGAFSVSLQCGQQAGSDCALESEGHPGVKVPVRTFLTLPPNVVDMSTGATVTKRRLEVGTATNQNRFVTKTFGQDRAGSIDFLVEKKDVDTMLKNTPDTYKGAVTVVFDPKIY